MASEQTQGIITEITAERERQITQEGWTIEHDNKHSGGQLAAAAAAYIHHTVLFQNADDASYQVSGCFSYWPWDQTWWKPKNPRRDLVRAAALIVAEIERLDRQSPPTKDEG